MSIIAITHKRNIKVCCTGDAGVGKTTFINQCKTGKFETKYNPTTSSKVTHYHGNKNISLNVWDYIGNRDTFYKNADSVIIFYDTTSKVSYENTKRWLDEAHSKAPDALLLLVGNKVDNRIFSVTPWTDCSHFYISVSTRYNLYKPFSYIINHFENVNTESGYNQLDNFENIDLNYLIGYSVILEYL